MPDTAPLSAKIEGYYPPVAVAGTDDDTVVGTAPYDCTVTAVKVIPEATITGAATNNRSHILLNAGQAGAGTVEVARRDYVNAVNAPTFDETSLTLTATVPDRDLVAGDALKFRSDSVGTGITDPGGRVIVEITRK